MEKIDKYCYYSTPIKSKYFDLELSIDLRIWGIGIGVDDMHKEYSLIIGILCFTFEFVFKPFKRTEN